MRLFDGLFKSFKSVRTFAMTTGIGQTCHHFPRWCPSRWNSIPCSWSNAPGQMDVKSPLLLQDLDVPGPVPLDEEGGAWTPAVVPLRRPSLRKRPGLRLLSRFKPLDSTSNSSRPSAPTTRSTLRSETSRCRNCQAICGTCQKNWLGCPSSTPTCPARPKTPWLRPYDERNLTERTRLRKRVTLPKKSVRDLHLEDFVSGRTLHFFRKLHLDEAFLDLPPDSWQMDEGFQRSSQIVRNLAVVNDHAERGVALIQEFNGSLTKDEEQLQFLLQVVADHRKAFPDPRKRTLAHTRPQ
ncbi:hypothetical protein GWK47_014487 [Chionoecetes opilio]|uniref:Uncharacterized protein n=1 Tax=Chionoecetes opilio TaxID=41210 RepID=A0A8J4XUS8_CHIOP|nr:hypothetical protein GWK47_014487 [Chionoecetes opilio]